MIFFRTLLNKPKNPPFDIEQAVGKYLLELPRCHKNVAIVSPRYREDNYTCELVLTAKSLASWAEVHARTTSCTDPQDQAARLALPLWLRGASDETSVSYVPYFMYKVLRPYVFGFVEKHSANIHCLECQSFVSDIRRERIDEESLFDWSWWTDVWICPNGHLLYHENHELHFLLRRSNSIRD